MIVDDNVIDQMITKQVLKNSHSQSDILVMDCPLEALNYLETNEKDIHSLPNLIILDLDMPGMNGFGFLERFSQYADQLKSTVKIVVLTATDVMEDLEQLNTNPTVARLISKPLSQYSLAEML